MYEITYLNVEEGHDDWEGIVKKVLDKCFEEEGLLDSKLIITITFTTPEEIAQVIGVLIEQQMCCHFQCLKKTN